MTGYVKMSRKEFLARLSSSTEWEIEVFIVNGGQQTRAIQSKMLSNVEVKKFRELPANYPVVTIYCGDELMPMDYHTVIIFDDIWSYCMYIYSTLYVVCSWSHKCNASRAA
jgi:hypothetical protein